MLYIQTCVDKSLCPVKNDRDASGPTRRLRPPPLGGIPSASARPLWHWHLLSNLWETHNFYSCVSSHSRLIINKQSRSRVPTIYCCRFTQRDFPPRSGVIMVRSFNKCFYLKWAVMHVVFLAKTLRGLSADCLDLRRTWSSRCTQLSYCALGVLSLLQPHM